MNFVAFASREYKSSIQDEDPFNCISVFTITEIEWKAIKFVTDMAK